MAGSTEVAFARLLSKFYRLHTYCKSLLREAVCVAIAAATRACRLPALLRSPPGSAYSYALQSLSQSIKNSFGMCIRSTGGRPASRSSRFVYVLLCGREAAREAETGRVLFALVSVVIKGHVFAENGSRGAVQCGDKDAGHLADGQTVKNCAIQKHRCFAFYTRSLWGSQKVHFLRIYMATARLSDNYLPSAEVSSIWCWVE